MRRWRDLPAGVRDHPRREFYVGSAIPGVGIGLGFASPANLIVEAVRADQTGVGTGMHTVMPSLGGCVGSLAFIFAAVACGLAAPASLAVARPGRTATAQPGRSLATEAA